MNLIKKLTGIFLIILYTLRIKKKPTPKIDNTDLNQLLETAIETKPKSETDYLLATEANKKRLLESVEQIKAKVEERQEKIETKVEEIKSEFDQKKCADVIAKVAEKVFNEQPEKTTLLQGFTAKFRESNVKKLEAKQAKGKKLNRKERNKINLYNKQNGITSSNVSKTNDTVIQQQNMINNVLLVSALDDSHADVKADVMLPNDSTPYTGSGGSFGGGGASSSWDDTPSKPSKPEPTSYSSPSYSHSRNDDYEYTPPSRSYSSSSSSSRSDDSSSYSSSYDSGSSYSSSDSSSSSSSSSDW